MFDFDNGDDDDGIEVYVDDLGDVAKPQKTGGSGTKQALQRPSRGAGTTSRGAINGPPAMFELPDDDDGIEVYVDDLGDVAKPQKTGGSGTKHELRRPSRRGGHVR
jgi:hypothetical protein